MQPLVTLRDDGAATISYQVPQPSIYRGQVTYQLGVNPAYVTTTTNPFASVPTNPPPAVIDIRRAMINGFADPVLFPQLGVPPGTVGYVDAQADVPIKYRPWEGAGEDRHLSTTAWFVGVVLLGERSWNAEAGAYAAPQVGFAGSQDPYVTAELAMLTPEYVQGRMAAGYRLQISKNNAGQYACDWVLLDADPRPGIAIIERYQLSSYLGNYGAGRTLQTFTLLPGEKSKVTIKSYVRSTRTNRGTSSILDSYDSESAQEFADTAAREHSNKQDQKDSKKWHVGVEAESDWGFVAVKASASYKGGVNASREQLGKELSSAVAKHATKASSKRDIKVTQSQEETTETGEESGAERELQNVNIGRTLNFVFRQMNQEYITLLHLVDVELLYSSGYPGGGKRYALSDLDRFLSDTIKAGVETTITPNRSYRDIVRDQLLAELQNIIDYRGTPQSFIEEVAVPLDAQDTTAGTRPARYYRPRRQLSASYTSQSGRELRDIRGIILSATETVLRTDGLIVEALLGQGEGLDDYSRTLQITAMDAAQRANEQKASLRDRKQLVAAIAASGDTEAARLFALLYPNEPCPPLPGAGTGK